MTTIARRITGGVDTHLDVHEAAALDERGAQLGVESFAATAAGYRELLGWLEGFGTLELVGVEGTGSYGAGLTRHLLGHQVASADLDDDSAHSQVRSSWNARSPDDLLWTRHRLGNGRRAGMPSTRPAACSSELDRGVMASERMLGEAS